MEIVTKEELPVEASMAGNNVCVVHCASLNRRAHYGVCLFTIRAYNNGGLDESSDCYSLVGRGLCEALKHQKQEQEAGRALFYKARAIKVVNVESDKPEKIDGPRNPSDSAYMRGWNQIDSSRSPVSRQPPKPKATVSPIKKTVKKTVKKSAIFDRPVADLSDAVEAAVKAQPKPSIKPGMSLLERARAMRGAKGA